MSEISAKKYITTNAKSTIFRVGVSTISTFIIIPFIIKNIGITNYSYVSITSFFVTFAGLFDIGLSKSLVYLINSNNEKEEKKNQYITGVSIINLVIIALIILLGFAAIFAGVNILGKNIAQDNPYFTIVAASSIIILAFSIYNMYQSALLESFFMLEHNNYGMMIKIMSLNIMYFINLITINSTDIYIISPIVSVIATTLYYHYISYKNISYKIVFPDVSVWKSIAIHCFEFCKIGILTSVNSALPNLSLIYIGNNITYVGILNVISKIAFSIINLFSTISRPLYALSRSKPQTIKKKMPLILSIYSIIGILFVLTIFLLRKHLIAYLFRDTVINTGLIETVLTIYIAGYAIQLLSQPLSQYLMGAGMYKNVAKYLFINTTAFVICFTLLYYFIKTDILVTLSIISFCISIIYTTLLYLKYKK